LIMVLIAWPLPPQAEELVTIPKARLEELERKEAELKRLKGDLSKARTQTAPIEKPREDGTAKITGAPPAGPAAKPAGQPVASLPPLNAGETVEAMDLADHYRADAAAADQRYRKRKLTLRGEVARFEKPMFRRDYKLIFKTADREVSVVCDIIPPEAFRAVFTIKNGSELVGLMPGDARVPIARIGDTVTVEGNCKGLRDSVVLLSGCELKPAR